MKYSRIFSKQNRALLSELVRTDFKLRYQGSALGYLWSLLKPLFMFAILYVVFGIVAKFGSDVEHYAIYLLLGIVLWGFFTEATCNGLQSIVSRGELIRKVNFPKYIIVISGTISSLINLLINLLVVGFFMVMNGVDIHRSIILFPVLIIELYIFSLALAFLLAALYVRFRDINYLWEVAIQAAFYGTPILYTVSLVAKESQFGAQLMLLSPIAQIIQDARYTLITHQTDTLYKLTDSLWMQALPFIVVLLTAVFASWYFKRSSAYFAERV